MMNGLIIAADWSETLKGVDDAVLGRLIKALIDLNNGVKVDTSTLKPEALMAFNFMRPYVIQNRERYLSILEKRKLAGAKGGKQKVANASTCYQNEANASNKIKYNKIKSNKIEYIHSITSIECDSTHARPATLDEVKDYFISKGYPAAEAEAFWDHYESNGWKVGKNPMRKWKAAVGNWMRMRPQYSQNNKKPLNQIADEYERDKRQRTAETIARSLTPCIEADERKWNKQLGADSKQGGEKEVPGCPF